MLDPSIIKQEPADVADGGDEEEQAASGQTIPRTAHGMKASGVGGSQEKRCCESMKFVSRCGLCRFETNSQTAYRLHSGVHDAARSNSLGYECEVCALRMASFDKLKTHRLLHFNSLTYCYVCEVRFHSQADMVSHMATTHANQCRVSQPTDDSALCVVCFNLVPVDDHDYHLQQHLRQSMQDGFSCTLCSAMPEDEHQLSVHFQSVRHAQELARYQDVFICSCRIVFPNRDSFAMHFVPNVHSVPSSPSWPNGTKDYLKEGDFVCDFCAYKTSRLSHYGHHIIRQHGTSHPQSEHEPKKAMATQAGTQLRSIASLMASRTGLLQNSSPGNPSNRIKVEQTLSHLCGFCRQQFQSRDELALHTMSHVREENAMGHTSPSHENQSDTFSLMQSTCRLCDRKFKQRDDLAMHVMTEHVNDVNKPEAHILQSIPTRRSGRMSSFLSETIGNIAYLRSRGDVLSQRRLSGTSLRKSDTSLANPVASNTLKRPHSAQLFTIEAKSSSDEPINLSQQQTTEKSRKESVSSEFNSTSNLTMAETIPRRPFSADQLRPPCMTVNPLLILNNQGSPEGSIHHESNNQDAANDISENTENIIDFVHRNRTSLKMCRFCQVVFADRTLYYLHMGLHNVNNPWQCNLCGHACRSVHAFSSHVIHFS